MYNILYHKSGPLQSATQLQALIMGYMKTEDIDFFFRYQDWWKVTKQVYALKILLVSMIKLYFSQSCDPLHNLYYEFCLPMLTKIL